MRYLYLILIPLMACHQITRTPHFFKGRDVVLSDTLYNASAEFEEYDGYAFYPIYYKGEMKDTIGIANMFRHGGIKNRKYFDEAVRGYNSDLELFVDTSVKTMIAIVTYKDKDWTVIDSVVNKNAYLMTIRNSGDSLFYIGDSHHLRSVYREVKNNNGEWIRIEKKLDGACVTRDLVYLKPGEIIISKVYRYKGNVLAPCRLVLSNAGSKVYSNTFMNSVDSRLVIL